jgi:hypothetical protein
MANKTGLVENDKGAGAKALISTKDGNTLSDGSSPAQRFTTSPSSGGNAKSQAPVGVLAAV